MASSTVSTPKRETDPKKGIVITGMGLILVFGSDIDTYYNKLLDGVSSITLLALLAISMISLPSNILMGLLELVLLPITVSLLLQTTLDEGMVAGGTEALVCPAAIGAFLACRALSQRNDEAQKA